jgi:hypothetical protein
VKIAMKHRFESRILRTAALTAAKILLLLLGPVYIAAAADPPPASAQTPLLDPWVPPEARKPSPATPTEGAALRDQVEHKLKQGFDAADVGHTGAITREQARAGGLGYIAMHFDEMDRQKTGYVRFDDVKRFLRDRGAQLN